MIDRREIAQDAGAEHAAPLKFSTVARAIAAKISKIAAAFELEDAQELFWLGWDSHTEVFYAIGHRSYGRRPAAGFLYCVHLF